MKKKHIYILIPLLTAIFLLIRSWIIIVSKNYIPQIPHYLAAIFIIPLILLFFKRFNWSVLYTGIYLLLASFNIFSLSPSLASNGLCFGAGPDKLCTPGINLPSFGVLLLFLLFNYTLLEDMYIEYSEKKNPKK